MRASGKYQFTAYVAESRDASAFLDGLESELRRTLGKDDWSLRVINVLETPEKALVGEIFATPTITRELPQPLIKELANAANIRDVLVAVIDSDRPPLA